MKTLEEKSKETKFLLENQSISSKQKMSSFMQGSYDANHEGVYFPFGVTSKLQYTIGYLIQKLPHSSPPKRTKKIDLSSLK